MAYIGSDPIEKGTGLFSQDTFTGDGSTTTFDLTNAVPDGGGNDIQVFVDNVRQQEGSSNAYTVGFDGSSVFKRITFTTAPASGQSIFVLNPGTRNVHQITSASDNSITTAKVQDLAISTAKIAADAINATKLADDAVSEEHLDVTAITGNTELSASAADDDVLLVFDTSAGTIKKIQRSNVALAVPTFSSVSPTSLSSGDGTGNHTIVVTGTKFDSSATFKLRTNGGTDISMDSVTRNSVTQLTGTVAKSTANLTNANEPFDIIITNGSGLNAEGLNQLNIDASPVYTTAAGTLGTVTGGSAIATIDIVAADPESTGNVTFEFQSGSLPAGLSSTTVNENGVSKFRITGTPTNPIANTTTNFTLRAVDASSNTTSRSFSITVNRTFTQTSFTSSGTFAVPSGMTTVDAVLVVAGGGGGGGHGGNGYKGGGAGAGGVIFMPSYPVTPGGTITVTVGCGGSGTSANPTGQGSQTIGNDGSDSVFGASPSPGLGQGGVLTAKGGGAGGGGSNGGQATAGNQGGSGGGAGASQNNAASQSTGTQPTQPGNSGAYGFGNGGGSANAPGPGWGAGGGGAGASGQPSGDPGSAPAHSSGGAGKAYTIADGTSSVTYAVGGNGGGLPGSTDSSNGQANKGDGGFGGGPNPGAGGGGGKGIVIVRY